MRAISEEGKLRRAVQASGNRIRETENFAGCSKISRVRAQSRRNIMWESKRHGEVIGIAL
jgi:hypothetical protein